MAENTQRFDIELYKDEEPSLFLDVLRSLVECEVVVVGGIVRGMSPRSGFTEVVSIIVAPVSPIYDAEKLTEFMHELLPDIERSGSVDAIQDSPYSKFHIGELHFDEVMGVIKSKIYSTIEATQPNALQKAGVSLDARVRETEVKLKRQTLVRVYPDAYIAEFIAKYQQGLVNGAVGRMDLHEGWLTAEQLLAIKDNWEEFLKRSLKFDAGKNGGQ